MTRVVLVTPRFAPDVGGIETVVGRLAAELVRSGQQVVVVTQAARSLPQREEVVVAGATVTVHRARRLPGLPDDVPAPGLYRLVRRLAADADVVHAHSYHTLAAPIAALAARQVPLVLSLHYHGGGHTGARSVLHRLYRPLGCRLVAAAAAVQVNSAAEAALVVRDFAGELTAEPVVVGHGVDPLAAAESFPTDRPVVLSVSRLEPYKHVDTLIAAAGRWSGGAELVVVGDGPDRPRLEALAADTGAPARFVGRVPDAELARWWATAAVLCSASSDESYGLTVAQALAAGVPCVVSDIAAHRELVDGVGTLVDGHDATTWAAAVDSALVAPRRPPLPVATWQDTAARFVELYREAAAR